MVYRYDTRIYTHSLAGLMLEASDHMYIMLMLVKRDI